jgi:tripeptide aminopeptidase
MVDCVHEAANLPDCDCDVDIAVQRTFAACATPASAPAVQIAEAALRNAGYEPTHIRSGGASDANALASPSLTVVNLANGTEHNHEPRERVSVAALEGMFDVALALPAAMTAQSALAAR